jgi:peptidoglycan/LPS O-acetylase OafA/YrhL
MRLCLAGAAGSFLLRVIMISSGAGPLSIVCVTPCRLDSLLAGSWVALARRDQADWARSLRCVGQLALGSGCLLLGIALGQRHFLPEVDPRIVHAAVDEKLVLSVGISTLSLFFAALIVIAVGAEENNRLRRLLENSGLRAIGKYSYAIYVFHALILVATVRSFAPLAKNPAFVAKPVTVIWVLAMSFALAWLSYHLYEKHFLRLKRYFEYEKPPRAATQASSQFAPRLNAEAEPGEFGQRETMVALLRGR